MSARHAMRELVRDAQRAGLRLDHGGKHPRIVHPTTGRFVVIAGTPSCPHAADNARKDLRRYLGIVV